MRTDRSAHRPGTSYSSTNGAGSGPATANSGAGSGFVLKDATVVEHAAPAAASGGGEAPRHVGLQEFRVIVEDSKLHLASHVNSQVEVQGHLATSATTSEQHGQAATGGGPRLNIGANAVVVTAIRTAAPGCPVG
ncbi:MAG TPA: hypothetical protein VFJ02_12215 [Vicinamibacterales bacterium]|nr:hypothetical protein [Vicinamibacterales bacterium]